MAESISANMAKSWDDLRGRHLVEQGQELQNAIANKLFVSVVRTWLTGFRKPIAVST